MEYRFGVCYCDLDINNEIKDLEIFNTYEEAYESYMSKIDKDNPRWIYPDLWIVWIRQSDNRIEQFEQLSWKTKCRFINIKE